MLHYQPRFWKFSMDSPVDEPEFLYPLLKSDEWLANPAVSAYSETGQYFEDGFTVVAKSKAPGSPVVNIADGTVTEVVRLTTTDPVDCTLGEPFGGVSWLTGVPCSWIDETYAGLFRWIGLGAGYWWGDDQNIWRVNVSTEYGTIKYVVKDANRYVRPGHQIVAGCYIGKTIPSTYVQGELLNLSKFTFAGVTKPALNEGIALISRYQGEQVELRDYLVTSPVEGSACNASGDTRDCLGNADLSINENWAKSGSVTFKDGGGALIGRNSFVISTRPYNLNENRLPQLKVSARNSVGTNTMRLKLGATIVTYNIISNSYQQYTIAPDAHQANVDDYYDIAVFNDGQGTIEIEYICVSHSLQADEETPLPPPPPHKDGCYFTNPYMDNDAQSWNIYAGDVTRLTGGMGVESGGEFGQGGIILFPNGEESQTYTLTLRANLWAFSSYAPTPTDATDISITYSLAGDEHTSLDTHTVGEFVSSEFGVLTYQNTFDVSSNVSGTIIFRVTVGTPATGLRGLVIRDACLEAGDTTNGDPSEEFPGFDDDGEAGTPGDRPFPEYCATPDYSGANGFVWLWGHLNSFFQCQLMVILNDIYEAIMKFFRMVGWFIRWVMMVIQMFINWISYQVLPWLAGYMVNIMGSQPNEVLYTSNPGQEEIYESCNWYDIFCHARNLFDTIGGVINGIGDFLGGLIQGVIDVIGWLLNGIVDVVEWLWEPLGNLINGIINVIRGLFEGLFQILQWIWQAITSVIEFIVQIATVIINALVSLVSTIVSWIVTIVQVIGAIITGASSATPQTITGLPQCTTPTSHALCLIYWALENTILEGLGAVFVPLLTAIFAIRFAIWYIAKWRATLVEVVTTS